MINELRLAFNNTANVGFNKTASGEMTLINMHAFNAGGTDSCGCGNLLSGRKLDNRTNNFNVLRIDILQLYY